jgi:homeobox-leucine zipper protein
MEETKNKQRGLERLKTSANDDTTGLALGVGLSIAMPATTAAQEEDQKNPPLPLELLPFRPIASRVGTPPAPSPPFLWFMTNNCREEVTVAETNLSGVVRGGIDMNQVPSTNEYEESSVLQVDALRVVDNGPMTVKRERERAFDLEAERDRTCDVSSRTSDEEEIGSTRKKLRLSKEQSALLEESFREHSTLNPQKQKNALAKQLNLRPRQVEVWFQNRRARTKLKQTEVDCEVLKRCCENLTEENRRLQKELQELRALKAAPQPCVIGQDNYYMPLPATTLTMCPSCERVATMENSHSRSLQFSKSQISQFAQQSAAC